MGQGPSLRNWTMVVVHAFFDCMSNLLTLCLSWWSCHFCHCNFFFFFLHTSADVLQAYKGMNGCTIVTGSALDGHSSVKVWGQHKQVSNSFVFSIQCQHFLEKHANLLAFPCNPRLVHNRFYQTNDIICHYLHHSKPCGELSSPIHSWWYVWHSTWPRAICGDV